MRNQTLTRQVELLTVDLTILRLIVAKMLVGILRTSEEPNAIALRRIVDEIHQTRDEGPEALMGIQATPELTSARIGALMREVERELKRQDE